MKHRFTYHMGAAAIGCMVLGLSLASPSVLISTAQRYVASAVVGMTVGVLPNTESSLAAQLAAKEEELRVREAAIQGKEGGASSRLTLALALSSVGMSLVLFMLIAFNFFLDMKRRGFPARGLSVDLRSQ